MSASSTDIVEQVSNVVELTCNFCGEFFPFRMQRNKHKCPFFNPKIQEKNSSEIPSSNSSTFIPSVSPVKPANYKLSLSNGRIQMKANYKCDLCLTQLNSHFSTVEELKNHQEKMHCVSRKELLKKKKLLSRRINGSSSPSSMRNFLNEFKCSKCDLYFQHSAEYRRHIIDVHLPSNAASRNKIFSETLCSSKNSLQTNEEILLNEYQCTLCFEKFAEKSQLFDHTANVHHKRVMYECSVCAAMYVHRLALSRHLQTHKETSDAYMPEQVFECEFCGKQFMFESFYKRHLATHTGASFFTCDICGDDFRSQNQLVLHRSAHVGDERFPCPVCKKQFAFKSLMERHHKTHIGEAQACHFCSKVFHVQSLLQKHITLEHGDEDSLLKCPECGKKFLYPSYLERHVVTHSLLKDQQCPMCPKLFAQRSALLVHLQTHLPRFNQVVDKPYHCPVCERSYKREATLDRHVTMFHGVGVMPNREPTLFSMPNDDDDDDDDSSTTKAKSYCNQPSKMSDHFAYQQSDKTARLITATRVRTTSGKEYFAVPLPIDDLQSDDGQRLDLNSVKVSVSYLK